MDVVLLLASFAVILAGALAVHQRGRVGRAPAGARRGRGRQPARGGRHGDARDADPDRRDHRRRARAPRTSRSARSSARRSCSRRSRWRWSGSRPRSSGAAASRGVRLAPTSPTLDRDLTFFVVFFALGIAARPGAAGRRCRSRPAIVFVARLRRLRPPARCAAGARCRRTSRSSAADHRSPRTRRRAADAARSSLQLLVGLGAIVGGAHLFVEELLTVADDVGVEPLVLSLVLAPLATELPEKANSFFWVREGKDSLALGNITGAMVFQSTIPVAFGLALTDWDLDRFAVVSDRPRARRRRARLLGAAAAGAVRGAADHDLDGAVRRLHRVRRARLSALRRRAASGPGRRASSARPSGSRARSCPRGR